MIWNTRWLKVETGISSSPVHSPVFTRSRWDKPSPSTARSGRLMIDPPMSSRTSRLFFAPIVGLWNWKSMGFPRKIWTRSWLHRMEATPLRKENPTSIEWANVPNACEPSAAWKSSPGASPGRHKFEAFLQWIGFVGKILSGNHRFSHEIWGFRAKNFPTKPIHWYLESLQKLCGWVAHRSFLGKIQLFDKDWFLPLN